MAEYATPVSIQDSIKQAADAVRATTPLVHCITNYVTVEGCADALLAVGGSPIMSDEQDDVVDITTICNALVINIGTLNKHTIDGMYAAGAQAKALGHPIVLDPVGAGASVLRTTTAGNLLNMFPIALVRGNMSEIKALAGASAKTRGVDVNPNDVVTDENIEENARFACNIAKQVQGVVAITGAIDLVADAQRCFAVRNGSPYQGRITGCGCMLTALSGAYMAAAKDPLMGALAAVVHMGVAGQRSAASLQPGEGTGTFRVRLMDGLSTLLGDDLAAEALVEQVL